MLSLQSPRQLFLLIGLGFVVLAALSLHLAMTQPWLGLRFDLDRPDHAPLRVLAVDPLGRANGRLKVGDELSAVRTPDGRLLPLTSGLLRANPGTLPDYELYQRQLEALGAVYQLGRQAALHLQLSDGRELILIPRAAGRPFAAIPGAWFLELLEILAVVVLVAGPWVFRPHDPPLRAFAAAGLCSVLTSLSLLPMEGRELLMDPRLLLGLHLLLWFSQAGYGCALAVLLWVYPQRLPGWRQAWMLCLPFALAGLAYALQLPPGSTAWQAGVSVAGLLILLALLICQWRRSRPTSPERRVVRLFAACLFGSIAWFAALMCLPWLFGWTPPALGQWIELGKLLSFAGLGYAIYRQQLFAIDRWVLRAWLLFGALLLSLVLELWLVSLVPQAAGLGQLVAVLLLALLYLPARLRISNQVWTLGTAEDSDRGVALLLPVLAETPDADPEAQWRNVLARAFKPLQIGGGASQETSSLEAAGLAMRLPALGPLPALRLEHADGGARRFMPEDLRLALLLQRWLLRVRELRQSAQRGAREERARIASDLHDDLVPHLLSLIYQSQQHPELPRIRQLMRSLRGIIRALQSRPEAGS